MKKEIFEDNSTQGNFERFVSAILSIFGIQEDVVVNKKEENGLVEKDDVVITLSDSYSGMIDILSDYESSPTLSNNSRSSEEANSSSETDETLGNEFLDAVRSGEIEIVAEFLKEGINPNFTDELGYTAAIEAVRTENIDMLELLLQYKVDLTAKNKGGSTVVSYAKQNDNFAILARLASYGLDFLSSPFHASNSQMHYYFNQRERGSIKDQETVISACIK